MVLIRPLPSLPQSLMRTGDPQGLLLPMEERCCDHPSYASRRPMLIDYNNLAEICLPENPVWIDLMLGDPVRVLVRHVWSVGIMNPHHKSCFLIISSASSVSRCEELGLLRKSSDYDSIRQKFIQDK